ncbi:hypothetical protein GH733_014465 [Mirounga leonina]|nr:hypothetical protein GH733_014465 [Mirounga leonina]
MPCSGPSLCGVSALLSSDFSEFINESDSFPPELFRRTSFGRVQEAGSSPVDSRRGHFLCAGVVPSVCIQMLSVQPDTKPKGCAGCNRKIKDRYLLKALDKYWHEDCLKCACCDCRLGEVGSTLYTKANLILCRRDYLRLFGVTGNCAACSKLIPAFEMVMRAKDNVYHLDCFACQLCNQRFCVGDKFFLKNNMILCQTDYEEGLMKEGYAPQFCVYLEASECHPEELEDVVPLYKEDVNLNKFCPYFTCELASLTECSPVFNRAQKYTTYRRVHYGHESSKGFRVQFSLESSGSNIYAQLQLSEEEINKI